jgi:hypothetical protein
MGYTGDMDRPSLSLIIVNYNGERWLTPCLESIQPQLHGGDEVIVVDNNSTDSSVTLLRDAFPWVHTIVSPENKGFASGNNLGFAKAQGEILFFLNTDIIVPEGLIESMVGRFLELQCDVLGINQMPYDGGKADNFMQTIDHLGYPYFYPATHRTEASFYVQGYAFMVRRDLYLESGGLDNDFFMYFEETDWMWRLQLMGKDIRFAKDIIIRHAGAGSVGSALKIKSLGWKNQNNLVMLLKNYSVWSLILAVPLYFLSNLAEVLFFALTGKGAAVSEYIKSWKNVFCSLDQIAVKRKKVQSMRILSDLQIYKKMYHGSAKLAQLLRK